MNTREDLPVNVPPLSRWARPAIAAVFAFAIQCGFSTLDSTLADLSLVLSVRSPATGTGTTTNPTASVGNVRSGGLIQSGFLIGTASATSATVSKVEVSLDSGSFSDATGTTTWSFALPTGSNTWKPRSSHTVAVRVTDSAGRTSTTTLTIRKGKNRDVNGDGIPELVAGAPGYSSGANSGRVYIFHGSSSGPGSVAPTTANTIIDGQAGEGIGSESRLADINGDGYADLVVGGWRNNTNRGQVYVFHSAGSSGIASATTTSANRTLTGQTNGDEFGLYFGVGDVNGDGFADLAVGARKRTTNTGVVYVYYSQGTAGLPAAAGATLTGEGTNSLFGEEVIIDDMTGDGFADVLVGAVEYTGGNQTGRIYIFVSPGSAGVATGNASGANTKITGENVGDRIGDKFTAADVNGDGIADLIAGATSYNGNRGRLYVFHGSTSGIATATASTGTANAVITGVNTNDRVGFPGSTDINGDGFEDIVDTSTNFNGTVGRVLIYHGSSSGITASSPSGANVTINGSGTTQFGGRCLVQDFTGDGYGDLAIGELTFDTNRARLHLFVSSNGSIPSGTFTGATAAIQGESTNDTFGQCQ